MSTHLQKIARAAPETPGVYMFRRAHTPIYIGKTGDLKKRLASYFRANAAPKVRALRSEADTLEWQETSSEVAALILEAELIKRHLPKYNVLLRDDKSYYYVVLTREQYPRIRVVHKTHLADTDKKFGRAIGPFTSGTALFGTLRMLRRIFPYCTCKEPHKRPCINAQIGRCPGFCCEKNNFSIIGIGDQSQRQKDYRAHIAHIIGVLSGKRTRILSRLKREMRTASARRDFERAARLRDQMAGLENVFSHRHTFDGEYRRHIPRKRSWQKIKKEIQSILNTQKHISRVEGYDISNISGGAATGSMVVFIDGNPAKSEYRKFKIKTITGANDVAMHAEAMRRRLAHPEWGMPDLLLIDGGLPQLHAVQSVLRPDHKNILLTALAKREEELYIDPVGSKTQKASADAPLAHRTSHGVAGREKPVRLDSLSRDTMLFFQHVRDESHRFAKKYHHKLREISYRERNPLLSY